MRGQLINLLLLPLAFVACAKTLDPGTNSRVDDAGSDDTGTTNIRLCTDELTPPANITKQAFEVLLGKFMGKNIIVEGIEGPVTYCLTLGSSTTTSSLIGTFRLEYEDDAGSRFFFQEDEYNVLSGELKQDVTAAGEAVYGLDLIFIDGYGLIEIKGSKQGEGDMTASLKYYNFPSFEDAIQEAADEARDKCGKELTYAQCLGYNYPQDYWSQVPQTPQQRLITEARAKLDDPTKTKTLGTMTFSLSRVLNQ